MAVVFNETGYTIEVHTGTNPIEDWLTTHDEMISLLQATDPQMRGEQNYYRVLELLRCMMPDWETAKKMMK